MRLFPLGLLGTVALASLGACGGGGGSGGEPGGGGGPAGPRPLGFTPGASTNIVVSFNPGGGYTLSNVRLADHDSDGTQDLCYAAKLNGATVDFAVESVRGLGTGAFGGVYPGSAQVSGDGVLWMGAGAVLGAGKQGFAFCAAGAHTLGYRTANGSTTAVGGYSGLLSFFGGLTVGDWNGDGAADVALTDMQNGKVLRYFSLGESGLVADTPITPPSAPSALTSGDWEGDTDDDLFVVVNTSSYVTFVGPQAGTAVPVAGGSQLLDPVSGDFDGDGKLDVAVLVIAGGSNPIRIGFLRGQGDGAFASVVLTTPTVALNLTTYPHLQTGDFDGDGKSDLVLLSPGSNRTCMLLGTATGVFAPFDDADFVGGGNDVLAVGDVDGDGDLDLVVGNGPGMTTRTLLNERF